MKLKPLRNDVLIMLDERSPRGDGSVSYDLVPATVMAVADRRREWTGDVYPCSVHVGDRVLLRPFDGNAVVHNGKACRIVTEYDIIAIIKEE